jgi:autonomous glycyl radical cofactor GrcA
MKRDAIILVRSIYRANKAKSKTEYLEVFLYDFEILKLEVRLCADTLKAAQKEPEKYRNLIVRVAGYSDYFNNLSKTLQDEIISRTEHQCSK